MSTQERFYDYLNKKKSETIAKSVALAKDDRLDESNVLKAEANIYDIAKAVYGACLKEADGDNLSETFLIRFNKITSSWSANLSRAKEHDDPYRVLIEEAKLAAVREITDYINAGAQGDSHD